MPTIAKVPKKTKQQKQQSTPTPQPHKIEAHEIKNLQQLVELQSKTNP
jgi:hypothetical protein